MTLPKLLCCPIAAHSASWATPVLPWYDRRGEVLIHAPARPQVKRCFSHSLTDVSLTRSPDHRRLDIRLPMDWYPVRGQAAMTSGTQPR